MNPLHASLDVHIQDSCNCLCWRTDHHVFIDENLVPKKFVKNRHGDEINEIYDRVVKIIIEEFDGADIDNSMAISMIEKISEITLTGSGKPLRPPKVTELRRIADAIDQIHTERLQDGKRKL